jgi:hypothetical protein
LTRQTSSCQSLLCSSSRFIDDNDSITSLGVFMTYLVSTDSI